MSDPASSLTFSIVVAHHETLDVEFFLGVAAALTIRSVLTSMGCKNVTVKWPNDVLADNKKICGVLLEKAVNGALVIGIGINVNQSADDFIAMELAAQAASMKMTAGTEFNLSKVFAVLIRELQLRLSHVSSAECASLVEEWNRHDSLIGNIVKVTSEQLTISGLSKGMTLNGQLAVVDDKGETHRFWSGDVSLQTHL